MRITSIYLFVGLSNAATIAMSVPAPAAPPPAAASSHIPAASAIPPAQGIPAPLPQGSLVPGIQAPPVAQDSPIPPAQGNPAPAPQASPNPPTAQGNPLPAPAQGGENPNAVPAPQGSVIPAPAPAQGGMVPAPQASLIPPQGNPAPASGPPQAPGQVVPIAGPGPQVVPVSPQTVPDPQNAPPPTLPPKPVIQNQPSVVSCAPEQPVLQTKQTVGRNSTGTASGKKAQSFVFWSNIPLNGTDVVMKKVLGAIESSGGVIKSNLTIKNTFFRGITGTAPVKVLDLVEEYGKLVDYQVERDCVATIGPISIGSAVRVISSQKWSWPKKRGQEEA